MKAILKTLLFALTLLPLIGHCNSDGTDTPETRVYIAHEEGAKDVLENMLAMFGRKLVSTDITNRPVSGRFEVRSVDDVMAYFQSAYKTNWFQNGVNVYTYQSKNWKTRRIYVGGQKNTDDWKDLLTSAGLYYKAFPFVFNPQSNELVVSGPKAYLDLVEKAFGQTPPSPTEIEKHGIDLMVFPLKYASVEDRSTTLRGQVINTPGVLSVLLELLNMKPHNKQTFAASNLGDKVSGNASNPAMYAGSTATRVISGAGIDDPAATPKNTAKPGDFGNEDDQSAPSVTADPRTNAILIRDARSKYDYYKKLIDQLDKPLQMVEVQAMLVEIDQKSLNELGTEFGIRSQHLAYDFPGDSVGAATLTNQGFSSIVDPALFIARLRALSAKEHAKVLAKPTIVTQDNVPAYIDLSQTVYLQSVGERVASVTPVTAGSLLQVTPRVVKDDSDDRIFMRIDIQDGSIAQQSAGITQPSVQNTSLSTQALIQRNKAILVGGYNRESTQKKVYKVPVLGSIPVLGKLFSSTQDQTDNMVRLFLIIPKLIDGPLHDSESSRDAVRQLKMDFDIADNPTLSATPTLQIDTHLRK